VASGCAAIEPSWVKETCDAASIVIFDGEKCIATCPGCCECGPFCDLAFNSVAACEAACQGPSCPTYIGSLKDCSFGLSAGDDGCPLAQCLEKRCAGDGDCAGGSCVLGSCVNCWEDGQCGAAKTCRTGRCVGPNPAACPSPGACSADGCKLVTVSEAPCPVCVCDGMGQLACEADIECQAISSVPYKHCVYGRCAECRQDSDCTFGACLPPGICFDMKPHPEVFYGPWIIGWSGGLDHYSYMRFEPDGTLRRGSYEPQGPYADDIPPLPCWPGDDPPSPLLGTWQPEITASGFLVLRLRLNVGCDDAGGWSARYVVNLAEDGLSATLDDVDSDQNLMAFRAPPEACTNDFSLCVSPSLF